MRIAQGVLSESTIQHEAKLSPVFCSRSHSKRCVSHTARHSCAITNLLCFVWVYQRSVHQTQVVFFFWCLNLC